MLIILEGVDGSGKSTIAEFLAGILGAKIVHCSMKTENTKEFFENILSASKKQHIIADRFCYGQYVYQDPEDRPMGDIKNLHSLELQMMTNYDVRVLYVTADTRVIETRLENRKEKIINGLTIDEVKFKYNQLFSETMMKPRVIKTKGGEFPWDILK